MHKMNKILAGHKYVANFLDAPVRLGMIYRMDDGQFIPAIHFNDEYPNIDLGNFSDSGSKGIIKFSAATEVGIAFGARTSGIEKSEVKFTFRKRRSVAGAIENAVTSTLRYGNVKDELIDIWERRGFVEFPRQYIFVYDVVTAASGTLIYSEESNNEVVLRHTRGENVSKIADLGSGNFEYVSNKKRTLEIIRNIAHRPLFKAFHFRRNWQPEILG